MDWVFQLTPNAKAWKKHENSLFGTSKVINQILQDAQKLKPRKSKRNPDAWKPWSSQKSMASGGLDFMKPSSPGGLDFMKTELPEAWIS